MDRSPHRERFHVPGPGPYALTHSTGCLPKQSVEALERQFLQPWQARGGDAWSAWLATVDGFRQSLARLLGGDAADYCPQANLSSGLAKLLPALPASAVRTVLLAAEDSFPSLGFVLQRAGGSGLRARLIPRHRDPSSLETWADAMAEDVSAVLLMHAYSNTGLVAPVAQIAALCRERGIRCIVDIAQSAGILPLSVVDFDADVVLGSCVKWLCGGPGAGFMWIRPALVPQLTPADVGWFSHENPFEFDIHSFRYAADARRFWGGTPSVAPYAIAAESIRLVADIGINVIRAHNRRLMEIFRAALPPPWRRKIDVDRIGGTICLPLGDSFADISRSLQAGSVRVDYRGAVVRISFHIYNTAMEAEAVARCWDGVPP